MTYFVRAQRGRIFNLSINSPVAPIFLLNLVKSGGNHFFALNGRLGSLGPIPTGSGALRCELNFLRASTRSRVDVLRGEIGKFSK